MINLLYDKDLRFYKSPIDPSRINEIPPKFGDQAAFQSGELSVWVNTDGYRLIIIAPRLPTVGVVYSVIEFGHADKRKGKVQFGIEEYFGLKHTVLRVLSQTNQEANKRISQMIESGDIPTRKGDAKGQGQPQLYADSVQFTISIPGALSRQVEELVVEHNNAYPNARPKWSRNRMIVHLLEIGLEGYDVDEAG